MSVPGIRSTNNNYTQCLDKTKDALLDSDNYYWLNSAGSFAFSTAMTIGPLTKSSEKLERIFSGTQFLPLFTFPFDCFNAVSSAIDLQQQKGKEAKIDHTFSLIASISEISDAIASIAYASSALAKVPNLFQWVSPLWLASGIASSAYFVISGRGLHFAIKLLKELKGALKSGYKTAEQFVKKRAYHLKQHVGVDSKFFLQTISGLKPKDLEKAYQALKEKIKNSKITHGLSIASTALFLISTIIFFVTVLTPFSIAAYTLLGIGFALSMCEMGVEFYAQRKFSKLKNVLLKEEI